MEQDNKHNHSGESLDTFSDDGTDLTLIRWMLSLTPDERLQLLEDHVAFLQDLRDANSALETLIKVKENSDRPKDAAALPVLRRTLNEQRRQRDE